MYLKEEEFYYNGSPASLQPPRPPCCRQILRHTLPHGLCTCCPSAPFLFFLEIHTLLAPSFPKVCA